MANLDAPKGFSPNVHQSGGTPARMSEYDIASGTASDIFTGDLVSLTGSGRTIDLAATTALATTRVLGVFAGVRWVDANGDPKWSPYWPTGTVTLGAQPAKAMVYDDPNLEFTAQITTVAAADIGQAFGWQVGTGNTTNGQSGAEINQGSATAADTVALITGLFEGPDGIALSEYGADAKVRCVLTNHQYKSALTEV